MAYYGTMAGCYVPGIPSTYANKLYKVSVGYSGCRGICLSKCSQDNRLTKTKQKRVSTLQIGQIYRQFGWRWDYLCSIYICLSLDFLRLTSNAVFLTWTCKVYISFRKKLSLDMHIHKICENWQKNTLSFYQFIKFCTTCRIINQKRQSFIFKLFY